MRHLRLLVLLSAAAQPAWPMSAGTAGADFLKLASGPRAIGMGSGFTAVGDDVSAVAWNPAGIAPLTAPEAQGSYAMDPLTRLTLLTGAGVVPGFLGGPGNLAAGFTAVGSGSFDSTDPAATVHAPESSATDTVGFLSYAMRLPSGLSLGASFKLVRRTMMGADPASAVLDPATGEMVPTRSMAAEATGAGADLGALWESPDRSFAVGGSVLNLGEAGRFGPDSGGPEDPLPVTVRLGGAWRPALAGEPILIAGDLASSIDAPGAPRLSLGAEYAVAGFAFFRAGWQQALNAPLGRTPLDAPGVSRMAGLPAALRTGLGLRWRAGLATEVQFDYAIAPQGVLGLQHQAAMRLRWNIPSGSGPNAAAVKRAIAAMVFTPRQLKLGAAPRDWHAEIRDPGGRILKSFQGTGLPPKSLEWDGTDDRGHPVLAAGPLKLTLTAKDVTNAEVTERESLAEVSAESGFLPVTGPATIPEVAFAMPQGSFRHWSLSVQNDDRLVRNWKGEGTPQPRIRWDGRDRNGQPVPVIDPRYMWRFDGEDGRRETGERALAPVAADVDGDAGADRTRLIGILYRGGASGVTDDHRVILAKAASFISAHPGSALTIEAYATAAGTDEANADLAKARAQHILDALVEEFSVEAASIRVRAYGRSRVPPEYPNIPEADQGQRVDLVITTPH